MRTTREVLVTVAVDGTQLALRYADLLEVERDDGTRDWECIVVTHPGPALALAPARVRLGGHDDSVRCGDALVVRSDGTSHVLRGVGDLTHGALT